MKSAIKMTTVYWFGYQGTTEVGNVSVLFIHTTPNVSGAHNYASISPFSASKDRVEGGLVRALRLIQQ